jgi:2',3'-cyclic-nucleotide 2'-phosphodiesterase (5'-nucleotidase family)
MEKIIITHTNDLHSHLENWPKIRRFLLHEKTKEDEFTTVITVDLGDFIDRFHPLSEVSDGKANIELMNAVHYDAVTIGNNEGIGNSKEMLDHLYDHANFDVLLGNLLDGKTQKAPEWRKDYKIITTKKGTKVGLFAFTAPFPLTYEPNGWKVLFPREIMQDFVEELRPQVDVLVLMSHLGIGEDKWIARHFPEIDVILGSHTHHLFEQGLMVQQTLLAAAGKWGNYVGKVTLLVDETHQILSKEANAIATSIFPELATDEQEIRGYLNRGHQLLESQEIARIPMDLTNSETEDYPLMQATLNAVAEFSETELAILNTGLFQTDLPKGAVNMDQLHQTLPHPMHIVRVTLVGKEFKRMIWEMEKNRAFLRPFPILGMGFRGKIFGEIVYKGITYDRKTKEVYVQGEKLEDEKRYTFSTVDHFMFIPFFPTIELVSEHEFLFPEFIRNVLANYLRTHFPLTE